MSKTLVLRPRLSEKTYGLSTSRVYVFDVPTNANKHEVARAVENQFDVRVTKVNITNLNGKAKRTISLTGKRIVQGKEGRQNNSRKAYVTLAEGNNLPFFAAAEEADEKQTETQSKVAKALEKQAKSESKSSEKTARRSRKNQVEDDK
ncbi:MAG TPA: 50S ribosomal protein L23 [Candidatus Saccharimonadales bacterium]|nr:50S ribosomal protein L23 [Candidatus Saccharimonadales bacterium]